MMNIAAVLFLTIKVSFIFIFSSFFVNSSLGGTCFSTMEKKNYGHCRDLIHGKISKIDCCATSRSASVAWTPTEHESSSLFFWQVFAGGVPCTTCKDSCTNVECDQGKRCILRKGAPKCICPSKCRDFPKYTKNKLKKKGPLCGTDGQTYKNWCRFAKKTCKQKSNKNIFVAYSGICQNSCDRIHCPDGKTCLLDQNRQPHCIHCVKKKCISSANKSAAVCGSDGVTYKSLCHLRETACLAGKATPIAYKGACQANITCNNLHCSSNSQKCLIDKENSGRPRCVTCSTTPSCNNSKYLHQYGHHGPVICGTNNNTYPSWCHMIQDSCNKGYIIETKHSGKCVMMMMMMKKAKNLWP